MLKSLAVVSSMVVILSAGAYGQTSIHSATTSSLLTRLATVDTSDSHYSVQDSILTELLRRKPVDQLIATYKHPANDTQAKQLLQSVLYHIRDKTVTAFMHSLLSDSATTATYYAAMYFAKCGDTTALSLLDRHLWDWPVSSWQMSYTVRLFGKYKYYPAIDNLIDELQAASLNLSGEALAALKEFYPNSPQFGDPDEAVKYFRKIRHSK